MIRKIISITICLLCAIPHLVLANVVINEILASNTRVNVDPDYNEYSDWVELYNNSSAPVDLSGYVLTDNFNDRAKWVFPAGTSIAANSYLLIWADGNNMGLHTGFKLSADGEELALVNIQGQIIDSLTFGLQEPNISMGRSKTDLTKWMYYTQPTPGIANNTTAYTGIVKSAPDFSVDGGIFHANVALTIHSIYGGTVRYTLDGTEPVASSPIASQSISITQNTVVRARIFKDAMIAGPVVTHSYFIDKNHQLNDLPIVSISTDPKNFWDPTEGIYVQDFKPDWEVPVNIELFETDSRDKADVNLQAGIKVNGLYSWQLPQKMLGVYFRKAYGAGKMDYRIIFNKGRASFDDFALRASGSDWSYTLFRDGLAQYLPVGYSDLDNSGFRACIVYVNGEYLGIHNIREKIDEDYIVGNHGLEPGTFDMVENEDFAETGDLDAYNYLLQLLGKDLTIQANWDAVASEMDISNFTDLLCLEIYDGNSSVDHNVMAWKPKDAGKWKWIIMDLDRGFFKVNDHLISFYINQSSWPFRQLWANDDYKHYFGLRLVDLMFTAFNPERVKTMVDEHAKAIEAEIPNHIKRWEGTSSSYGNPIPSVEYWQNEVNNMKLFADARPSVILNDLTKYGFESPVSVAIATIPEKAGHLTFNGFKIPVDNCLGGYPKNETITLTAEAVAGYRFLGWQTNKDTVLIAKEQPWKYNDNGVDLTTQWQLPAYSDAAWSSGNAELGYGDGDENTVVSYGNDASNKYLTYYFRKTFNISEKQRVKGMTLNLKCDDGAVVYINGVEVMRYNMPSGDITFNTTAVNGISGANESDFHTYSIDQGTLVNGANIIAVEVHQDGATSSDISFDLELNAQVAGGTGYLSTKNEYSFTTQSNVSLMAVFERDGKCLLPTEITSDMTLEKDCSPYIVANDVTIAPTATLTIEPGVEIWLSDGASIYSSGVISAMGTKTEPIVFKGNPELSNSKWGFISILNVADTNRFIHVNIEDASCGERTREVAAITAYRSNVLFDSVHFENIYANPIATRYCKVILRNSSLHSNVVGDLINITRGEGLIENCDFIGNYLPDNDAIDFNGSSNIMLRNCTIRDFFGPNSDGVDLGERASNILIEGLYVHDITDKGLSVGQQSYAYISNSLFTNCNLGVGVKDSSNAFINHCTFYGTGQPVASYEKIVGRAGGNVKVTNSILSNSYKSSYLCDKYSTIDISYSASDNDPLPAGQNNLFVNPQLNNPTIFDFTLKPKSPCIGAGSDGDMGSGLTDTGIEPEVMISDIAYLSGSGQGSLEFIGLYNPGDRRVNISGYIITSAVEFTFPEGSFIDPQKKVYVTNNAADEFWIGRGAKLYQWTSGKLADEGEDIQLTNEVTTMIDEVDYGIVSPWPEVVNSGDAISLKYFDVDNHFGEYWEIRTQDSIVGYKTKTAQELVRYYPNPSNGVIYLNNNTEGISDLKAFDLSGKVLFESYGILPDKIDLSAYRGQLIILNVNGMNQKVVILP